MAKTATALEYVDNLAVEHKIPYQMSYAQKLLYVNNQIEEFAKVIFRHQVDVRLSEELILSDNPQIAAEGAKNRVQYTAVIKQMAVALKICLELRSQLEPLADAEAEAEEADVYEDEED